MPDENPLSCASLSPMQVEPAPNNYPNQPSPEACPLSGSTRNLTAAEHHSVFCPTCSTRLRESRCKLICHDCGYFLSCADFY